MRCRLCRWAPRIALALIGAAAIVLALGAYQLGFDNNPAIGPKRILLLLAGSGLLYLGIRHRPAAVAPDDRLDPEAEPAPARAPLWAALAIAFATLAFFAWQTYAGDPLDPPRTTYYYDMQAEAFASGQTSLKVLPDPSLAEIRDPYDPAQRRGMPRCRLGQTTDCFLNDASYFEGRYYLYWGPAPAVLLSAFKLVGVGSISDGLIALIGASALFLVLASVVMTLFRQSFARLPSWLIIPSLALCGLAYPLSWILDAPFIYESAVILGALFLAAGMALAIPVLTLRDRSLRRLALVGTLWGLAFATRALLILSVAVLAAGVIWSVARPHWPGRKAFAASLAAVGLPILAIAILHAAYNFERFADPLEFGWRYQLQSGLRPLQATGSVDAFQPGNLAANLRAYLAAPFTVSREFPFLNPQVPVNTISFGALGPFPLGTEDSTFQYPMVGLLVAAPFFAFTAYAAWWWLCGVAVRPSAEVGQGRGGLPNLVGVLIAASLCGLVPVLTDYVVTPRYLMDVFPFLVVLASLGAWELYRANERGRAARWVVSGLILIAAIASVVLSTLLALNNWTL